jgi:hypothetical protein
MTTHEFEIRDEIILAGTPSRCGTPSPPAPDSTPGSWGTARSSQGRAAPTGWRCPATPRSRRSPRGRSAPHVVGVHTPNGILMLIKGYMHSLVVEYHGFSDDEDEKEIETAYQSWLDTAFV